MYKTIMVAIDDSDTSQCALEEALHLARTSDAKLLITHVADETLMGMHGRTFSSTLDVDGALSQIAQAGRKLLDEALQLAEGIKAETLLLEARNRRVSEVMVDQAKAAGVDLIVIGRHSQRGLARLILGSVAEQVAKMADTSVLLVRKH
ncbi:MAG: universal stress protein [Dechloromonas sp.]|nr:universal stress protein [Dechloromonas sp.]